MNKYQDALNLLKSWAKKDRNAYSPKHLENINDKSNILQELVDKTIPTKPTVEYIIDDEYYICSHCRHIILDKRTIDKLIKIKNPVPKVCDECGQMTDWSENDE